MCANFLILVYSTLAHRIPFPFLLLSFILGAAAATSIPTPPSSLGATVRTPSTQAIVSKQPAGEHAFIIIIIIYYYYYYLFMLLFLT